MRDAMEIDFLAVSHNINKNIKQTGAWLVANRDTENIFTLLFTYSDMRHLMADPEPAKGPEGKAYRSESLMNGPASQADPAALVYFRESCTEFTNSFKLAESSFYRYAFAALRNALEAGIMSIISEEPGVTLDPTRSPGQGLQQLPDKEMIDALGRISNVRTFCKRSDIIERCRELHQELSGFSGGKNVVQGLGREVPPVSAGFDEKVFIRWSVSLRKTIRLLLTLFVLKYPVAMMDTPVEKKFSTGIRGGPFLNSEERECLVELLDGDDLDILIEITKNDPYAIGQAAGVNSYPDIVEEEFSQQLKGFKKELHKISTGKIGGL